MSMEVNDFSTADMTNEGDVDAFLLGFLLLSVFMFCKNGLIMTDLNPSFTRKGRACIFMLWSYISFSPLCFLLLLKTQL